MKRIWEVMILVAAAVVILTVFSGFQGVQAQSSRQTSQQTEEPMQRTVTVTGVGRVQVQPDQAIIFVGVQTEADNAEDALDANSEQMQAVITALNSAGIDPDDVQTQSVQVYPRYSVSQAADATQEVIGYQAVNTVEVLVRELDNLGSILDSVVQAGSNRIDGIRFEVSDPVQAMDQARVQALADARHKAEELAQLTESALGQVVAITENSYTPGPLFAREAAALDAAQSVPIEPGTQTVELNLQVTWALNGSTTEQTSAADLTGANVSIRPQSGVPGTTVTVSGSGFPVNSTVNVAVGKNAETSELVDTVRTDRSGSLQLTVTIPDSAQPDEHWLVIITMADQPDGQISSNEFTVTS